jgi:hypothetical protein
MEAPQLSESTPDAHGIHARRQSYVLALLPHVILALFVAIPLSSRVHLPGAFDEPLYFSVMDDVFYYTKTAANFWTYGFYTFDGITHTNGFHPLWMWICTALALPLGAHAIDWLPSLAVIFNLIAIVAAAHFTYASLRLIKLSVPFALFLSGLPALLVPYQYLLNGMETGVLWLTYAALGWYLIRQHSMKMPLSPWKLGLLSALVFLSRLDSAVLLIFMYIFGAFKFGFRVFFLAGIFMLLLAAPYLAWNMKIGGSPLPISGQVKSDWTALAVEAQFGNSDPSLRTLAKSEVMRHRLSDLLGQGVSMPLIRVFHAATLGHVEVPADVVTGIKQFGRTLQWALPLVVLMGIAGWMARRVRGQISNAIPIFGIVVVSGLLYYLFQLIYYPFFSWRLYPWYIGVGILQVIALTLWALFAWCEALPAWARTAFLSVVALPIIVAMIREPSTLSEQRRKLTTSSSTFDAMGYWLRDNMAPDEVAVSWAAGRIGAAAGDRAVVNMEGLIADRQVAELNKAVDPTPWWVQQNVRYVANHYPMFTAAFEMDFCKLPSLDYFWSLRSRPLFEYSNAFKVVYRMAGGGTAGMVFEIDRDALRLAYGKRMELEQRLRSGATMLPAEEMQELHAGSGTALYPFTNRLAYTAREIAWNLPAETLPNTEVVAKCYVLDPSIQLATGQISHVRPTNFPTPCGWAFISIGTAGLQSSESKTIRLQGLSVDGEVKAYIDELYLVPSAALSTFNQAAQEYVAFTIANIGVPEDPSPGKAPVVRVLATDNLRRTYSAPAS